MLKQLLILTILLSTIGLSCAGEIVFEKGATVYIYNDIEQTVRMSHSNNYNKTVCINATVIEGEIGCGSKKDYELEYTFIADINDSTYISRILIMKQEILSNSLFSGKVLNRTLYLDGIIIGNYKTKTNWLGHGKTDTVYFNLIDNNIRYGDNIILNESLAFTQLNYVDQYNFLESDSSIYQTVIYHKYISISYNNDSFVSGLQLTGLTGIFYNVFGESVLTKLPVVGGAIASFGKSIQSLLFLPLTIIQYTFNFIFSFLFLIINNWWYALLILEIMCIIPALQYKTYPEMTGTFINMHVKIFKFMWENVILNLINLVFRIIEIIRNMFRI